MYSLPFEAGAGGSASPPPFPAPSSPPVQGPSGAVDLLAELTGPCTLRDGAVVMVRPIRDDDERRMQEFHLRLSSRTLYLRFGHLLAGFPDQLATWLTCVDGDQRMAFVATDMVDATDVASPTHEIIGVARYEHVRPLVAEVAEVIADRWQGRGLGPQLLYRLAVYARSRGYATLVGFVRGNNERAMHALPRGAFPYTLKQLDEDTLLATVDITHAEALRHLSVSQE